MDQSIDILQLLQSPEKISFPGALMTRHGPKDYVGSMPAVAGTLFFKNAHTPEVREAICQCFEEFEAIAKEHLTWLWRDEPSEGPDKIAYPKAKPMREVMQRMDKDDAVGFGYISGKKPEDAGDWMFYVNGWRGWEAKLGKYGLNSLRFAIPLLYMVDNPKAFQTMFVSFAKRLHAVHGYGGLSLVSSLVRRDENEPFEAYMSEQINGLDVGGPVRISEEMVKGIKTVSWLTAINSDMVQQIGGLSALRSELPMDWFAKYDYGSGIVIQAGPRPHPAPVKDNPKPAIYVLPNMLLKEVRTPKIGWLHGASKDGEPRIIGEAAEDWLKRFDVPEAELLAYKAKLLTEPKLTKATTLDGAL